MRPALKLEEPEEGGTHLHILGWQQEINRIYRDSSYPIPVFIAVRFYVYIHKCEKTAQCLKPRLQALSHPMYMNDYSIS